MNLKKNFSGSTFVFVIQTFVTLDAFAMKGFLNQLAKQAEQVSQQVTSNLESQIVSVRDDFASQLRAQVTQEMTQFRAQQVDMLWKDCEAFLLSESHPWIKDSQQMEPKHFLAALVSHLVSFEDQLKQSRFEALEEKLRQVFQEKSLQVSRSLGGSVGEVILRASQERLDQTSRAERERFLQIEKVWVDTQINQIYADFLGYPDHPTEKVLEIIAAIEPAIRGSFDEKKNLVLENYLDQQTELAWNVSAEGLRQQSDLVSFLQLPKEEARPILAEIVRLSFESQRVREVFERNLSLVEGDFTRQERENLIPRFQEILGQIISEFENPTMCSGRAFTIIKEIISELQKP